MFDTQEFWRLQRPPTIPHSHPLPRKTTTLSGRFGWLFFYFVRYGPIFLTANNGSLKTSYWSYAPVLNCKNATEFPAVWRDFRPIVHELDWIVIQRPRLARLFTYPGRRSAGLRNPGKPLPWRADARGLTDTTGRTSGERNWAVAGLWRRYRRRRRLRRRRRRRRRRYTRAHRDGRERGRDARGRAERLARGECTGQAVQRARRLTRVREAPTNNVYARRRAASRRRRPTRRQLPRTSAVVRNNEQKNTRRAKNTDSTDPNRISPDQTGLRLRRGRRESGLNARSARCEEKPSIIHVLIARVNGSDSTLRRSPRPIGLR